MRARIQALLIILAFGPQAFGQQEGPVPGLDDNRRCKTVAANQPIADEHLIAPGSIMLVDSTKSYKIETLSAREFIVRAPTAGQVDVCYRVLPAALQKKFRLTSVGKYDSTALFRPPKGSNGPLISRREELFDLGEINQGGHISRGITVGNTQDLFVNSSLNLNLEGKISNDLNIRASITDQTIPYQPEGNTQQLQDFDNVFVELYNDKFSIVGGDVVLQNKDTYFLRYLKNVQGGLVSVKTAGSTSSLGLSAAKGQFASVTVAVAEGILGPYKVPSPANQGYVIIIANSEKVFIDGKQLVRGYNNDYTLDYNQAEINFTSNVVITNYSRVRIDYEYAVRDFTRSVMSINHTRQFGKLSLSATYYKEADNPNRPLFTELSEADKGLLQQVGNEVDKAVVTSARQAEFSPDKILYFLKDTLTADNRPVQVYQHTTQNLATLYTVSFVDVGAGKGSYVIKEYLAQGRVYAWVGPGKGSYAPYKQLAAPNKKEMLSLRAGMQLNQFAEVYVESAFSNQDKNLFSGIGNETNKGYALKGGINIKDQPVTGLGDYKLQLLADIEYLEQNFLAIDRFRRVEFDRDWSYKPLDTLPAQDLIISTAIGLRKDAGNGFLYQYNNRNKENQVVGAQHLLTVNKLLGKLQVNANGLSTRSNLYLNKVAAWNKVFAETYLQGSIQPGYRYQLEQNTVRTMTDSLVSSANYFAIHEVFIRNNPAARTKFELAYATRNDRAPVNGELRQAGKADNARARLTSTLGGHAISMVLNYRIFDDMLKNDAVESITGRVDWTGDIIKQVWRSELNYSVANARVPKREYVFIEVPTGQGTHTWRDDNGDGIKDLNEFYEAIFFDEKNYIKLYVNTSEFIDAYENVFNYRATLKAPKNWRQKPGILNLLARISNTTSWASQYRTTENTMPARLIPFLSDIDEDQVLSLREALRTTFFINKSNPKFGLYVGYATFRKKYLYTNGFESRDDEEVNLTIRWNINRVYNLKLRSLSATRLNRSDYLAGRNYDIKAYEIGPSFSWQPKPTFRLTGRYTMGIKNSYNSSEKPGQAALSEIIGELKMGLAAKYMLNATAKFSKVAYDGNELTPLGYEMLQGLRPGDNFSWSVGWQQRLLNGLQINLFYEGRKPEGVAIIHSGRASVSALF